LQDRLWQWTTEQQQVHQAKITGDFLTNWVEGDIATDDPENSVKSTNNAGLETKSKLPNSLAEWSRTVDLDNLRQKRKEIHRQKRQGVPSPKKSVKREQSPKEYLQTLSKVLQTPSSPYSSNVKSKELYVASKKADQAGDKKAAMQLLQTLLEVTPNDGRVYRRLSRMHCEQGDIHQGRSVMQMGIRRQPNNPWLWHGLAKLEQSHGDSKHKARKLYKKAIQVDPAFAHSYHALGTFEHTEGNIAQAMKILKKGIEFCPTNHRLHHALGDIYRGAKLLEDAERSYRRSLEHGAPVNYCFGYSALACVAFEREQIPNARKWLQRSIQLNDGRHAQGWVSLAHLEESQGNIEEARSVCAKSIAQYERGLIETRQRYQKQSFKGSTEKRDHVEGVEEISFSSDPLSMKNMLLKAVPKYRSGDKFIDVYRNWARLEERYGSFESVDEVYARASLAFPFGFKLQMDWASYYAKMHSYDRARSLYMEACNKATSR
jgi:tetratricopeptide (TPR) repeat protein